MKKALPKSRQFRKMFTIQMPLCLAEIYEPTHCFGTRSLIGRGINNIAFSLEQGILVGYFSEDDITEVGKRGLTKLLQKKFVVRVKKESFEAARAVQDHSLLIDSQNLTNLSNSGLLKLYLRQIELIRSVYTYFNASSPAIALALEDEIDRLFQEADVSSSKVLEIKGQYLQNPERTTPETEEAELKKISLDIKANKKLETLFLQKDYRRIVVALRYQFCNLDDAIDLHKRRYDFLQGYVDFHRFDKQYYLSRLSDLLALSRAALQKEIQHIEHKSEDIRRERAVLKKKYKLEKRLSYLLEVSSYFAFHRMEMRVYYTLGLVALKTILDELSRRMNVSTEDVRWLLIRENVAFLKHRATVSRAVIKDRKKLSIYHIEDKRIRLKTGTAAEWWRKTYLPSEDFRHVSSVKGNIGSPGVKRGHVKLILDTPNIIEEIAAMKPGSVLITRNTRPDMIVACKKASAIVTDEGGILSHAALVSREFGIPCVIATWNATKIFKDGDLVEVDANKGLVRRI